MTSCNILHVCSLVKIHFKAEVKSAYCQLPSFFPHHDANAIFEIICHHWVSVFRYRMQAIHGQQGAEPSFLKASQHPGSVLSPVAVSPYESSGLALGRSYAHIQMS